MRSGTVLPTRIAYLELVAPRIDRPEARSKWLFWLNRDFPWAFDEGWSVEYWGLRDWHNRVSAWGPLRVRGPRIPFRRVPWVVLACSAWFAHLLMALFSRRPGILLARSPYLGLGAALVRTVRRRRVRLVVRIVERKPSTALRVYGARGISRAMEALERFVLRRADLVIPIAGFTREVAERAGVPKDRILQLPNPPRWGRVEVPELPKASPPRVVTAARLEPVKGIDVLLRAFAKVAAEFPAVSLEIAGEGTARPGLEQLARELGVDDRVVFHGWVPSAEMPGFFGSALVAVLPSRVEEGHPMALREAALAGCALLGTDLGGTRDIVEPGRTGFLVPPEDDVALAEALRRLLEDPEESRLFGAQAREAALAYFEGRDLALGQVRERVYALIRG